MFGLFVAATIVHVSAANHYRPGDEAAGYATGMVALLAATSIAPALPEVARPRIAPAAQRALDSFRPARPES